MYGYVYKTTNLINHKIYVGQHTATHFDASYYGSGRYLLNALNKYGKENFEVVLLEECEDKHSLNNQERDWISLFNSQDHSIGYNISSGGDGGDVYSGLSEEDKQEVSRKLSEANSGKIVVHKGEKKTHICPELIESYLENGWVRGGCTPTDKQREKTSNTLKGTIFVTNGEHNKRIFPENIKEWENKGYWRGTTETLKMREAREARVERSRLANEEALNTWVSECHVCETCGKIMTIKYGTGRFCSKSCSAKHSHSDETKQLLRKLNYQGVCGMRGKHLTDEQKLHHSVAMKGKGKDTRWLTNGFESVRVTSEEIEEYLHKGFWLGRTGNFSKK